MLGCGTKEPVEGQRPKASFENNPPCDSGEFLNSCHIGKLWKMYAMNNVWMVLDDCLGTRKTPKKASPEKTHVSQETGLDWTWSEEPAPNALTWAQEIPQLNEPMQKCFSSNHILKNLKTSKTYQIQVSKADSPQNLCLKMCQTCNGCLESLLDISW